MSEPRRARVLNESIGPMAEKVQAKKVGEDAARRLAELIFNQQVPSGTALPPERELAETLGIGRGTMREALRILQIFGLLDSKTGRYGGPVVSRPDADDLSVALTLSLKANGATMLDVLDARAAIEPRLASLAAERVTPHQVTQMRESVAAMREKGVADREFQLLATRFHDMVADAAGSRVLSLLAAGLHSIAGGDSVGIAYGPRQIRGTADAHERIINAIEARDPELAAQLWQQHLGEAERFWRKAYPKEITRTVEWTI
jgi:DNA-binding FadR family transcriptional regulator